MQRNLVIITAVALFLLAGLVLYFVVPNLLQVASTGSDQLDYNEQPFLGAANPPVTLAIFEDFRCPHCKDFTETTFKRLEQEFVNTGQARVYFYNFAILGEESTLAAMASECVYQQDNRYFWPYKEALMANQDAEGLYTIEGLTELARANFDYIDTAALQQCLENGDTAAMVEADNDLARSLELPGTPALVVNGAFINAFPSYEVASRAIRQALNGEE